MANAQVTTSVQSIPPGTRGVQPANGIKALPPKSPRVQSVAQQPPTLSRSQRVAVGARHDSKV